MVSRNRVVKQHKMTRSSSFDENTPAQDSKRVIQSSLIILLQVPLKKTDGKSTRPLTLCSTNPFSTQMLAAFRGFLNTTLCILETFVDFAPFIPTLFNKVCEPFFIARLLKPVSQVFEQVFEPFVHPRLFEPFTLTLNSASQIVGLPSSF